MGRLVSISYVMVWFGSSLDRRAMSTTPRHAWQRSWQRGKRLASVGRQLAGSWQSDCVIYYTMITTMSRRRHPALLPWLLVNVNLPRDCGDVVATDAVGVTNYLWWGEDGNLQLGTWVPMDHISEISMYRCKNLGKRWWRKGGRAGTMTRRFFQTKRPPACWLVSPSFLSPTEY